MATLKAAKWGDIALLVVRHTDDGGLDWVTQSPARGDRHVLQNRGLRHGRTRCEIIFCDEPGVGTYLDRFLVFQAASRSDAPRLFLHPINGSYLAVVADFVYECDNQQRCVTVSCTFLAEDPPQAVFPIAAGTSAAAGPEQVGTYAAVANTELADVGLSSPTPASCLTTVTAWSELEDPDARAIALQASSLCSDIDTAVATLELATSLERWEAYRSMVNLRYSVVRAAESVTSETAQVTEIVLTAAEPLLAICARVFGAREAQDRARQVAKLNGLRTPGLVPVGTRLKLPASGVR